MLLLLFFVFPGISQAALESRLPGRVRLLNSPARFSLPFRHF